jgi:protein-S-isoprenylcysteine O-methyltransferase Ste14
MNDPKSAVSDSLAKEGGSAMGVSPRVLPFLLPLVLAATLASVLLPGPFRFEGRLRSALVVAAVVWGVAVMAFYLDLARRLLRALKSRTLATGGAYALCRHPLFAWAIFFVFPVVALATDNWLFFVVSVALVFIARRFLWIEEAYLERTFGEEYRAYEAATRALLPIPRRRLVRAARRAGNGRQA